MAITADQLYDSSQITPAALGDRINRDLPDEQQREAAIAWLDTNAVRFAVSEVAAPFRTVTGAGRVAKFIAQKFGHLTDADQDELVDEGDALFDAAALSYGRSAVNKLIASDESAYDKDADQDRKTGNEQLEKLLEWGEKLLEAALASEGADTTPDTDDHALFLSSISVPVQPIW